MSIKQLTSKAKDRQIAVYDLEWHPETLEPRLFGYYDGSHYRAFEDVDTFMREAVLSPENRNRWAFAHAGGLYDFTYLLEWLADHKEYQVTSRFSGSAAVNIEIAKKEHTRTGKVKLGDKWTLCDSYFLLRTKLRDIGEWLGQKKGGEEGSTAIFYAPFNELRDYNEKDCRILYNAIRQFADQIMEMGGELKPTTASTAMALFRRKYLSGTIRTSPQVNDILRSSYIASRVEVLRKLARRVKQYDINSSFPYSMTQPHPGELLTIGRRIPDSGECFFAEVLVEVPEMDIPPLPFRHAQKVFFPTGKWLGWLSGPDIRFLEECGGRVLHVREVLVYDERNDLAEYVTDLYEKRRKAKTAFEKVVYKFLLNSLYGKFGERTEKQTIVLNPVSRELLQPVKDSRGRVVRSGEEIFAGAILVTADRPIAHEHVPIASHVTALSRRLITRYLRDAHSSTGILPYYCDTDCLVTEAELPTSDALGALKLENEIQEGKFYAPKFYCIDGKVKAKGFTGITPEAFQRLVDGYAGIFERQARPKEMFRRKSLEPERLTIPKQLRFGPKNDKRKFTKDGSMSRPYSVDEICEMHA